MLREIGDGTCGNVFMAYNVETNEIVSSMTHLLKHFAVIFVISNQNLVALFLKKNNEPPVVYALFYRLNSSNSILYPSGCFTEELFL